MTNRRLRTAIILALGLISAVYLTWLVVVFVERTG